MRKTGGKQRKREKNKRTCILSGEEANGRSSEEERGGEKTWGWSGEAAKREKYGGRERRFKKMWRVKMSLAHAMKDVATLLVLSY